MPFNFYVGKCNAKIYAEIDFNRHGAGLNHNNNIAKKRNKYPKFAKNFIWKLQLVNVHTTMFMEIANLFPMFLEKAHPILN